MNIWNTYTGERKRDRSVERGSERKLERRSAGQKVEGGAVG